jgi:carotenoid cleavage dioxygenase-like enzyme
MRMEVTTRLNVTAVEENNDYLADAFQPIDTEITAYDLNVKGEIPRDLDGVYARNGHNPVFRPQSGKYHWFDGDSMIHATHFEDGKATYRNRWVRTAGLLRELEAGRGLYSGLRDGFQAEDNLKNNSGTDIALHNGEFKTMFSRCGQPYRLDPMTMETLGPDSFGGKWSKGVSAHSKTDEKTGEFIFFNYSFNTAPFMEYGVVDAKGELSHVTEIELPGPRLPHDAWFTENYTVLHDLPLYWDPNLLKAGRKKLTFNQALPSRFGVIPRHGSGDQIRWFEAEPTYILHTTHSWEEGDEIVAYAYSQLVPVPNIPAGTHSARTQNYFLSINFQQPRLKEYRFNLKTGQTKERFVDDQCCEMPGFNTNYNGIKARYSYNMFGSDTNLFLMSGVQKFDYLKMQEVDRYMLPDGKFMGQPVFADRKDAKDEDDGYLMAYVFDAKDAEIYIWDGKNIGRGPLAVVEIPQRMNGGSHAYWGRGDKIRAARDRRFAA